MVGVLQALALMIHHCRQVSSREKEREWKRVRLSVNKNRMFVDGIYRLRVVSAWHFCIWLKTSWLSCVAEWKSLLLVCGDDDDDDDGGGSGSSHTDKQIAYHTHQECNALQCSEHVQKRKQSNAHWRLSLSLSLSHPMQTGMILANNSVAHTTTQEQAKSKQEPNRENS